VAVLYRREDLAAHWPVELGAELAALNDPLKQAIQDFIRRLHSAGGTATSHETVFALIDVPYSAVRRYLLQGRRPPTSLDRLVTRVAHCLLFADSQTC
jgi:hypothetical protein